MPTYRVTDKKTGVTLKLTGDRPPTEEELQKIFSEYSAKAATAKPVEETPKPVDKTPAEDPNLTKIAAGLAAEVGIGMAGQATGAALMPFTLGISYPVLAFTSGVGGSLTAQKIEGRDDISLGRALFAGAVNLIPGSSAAKGGVKLSTAVGKEALRGAAIGAGEATATAVVDEGRPPTAQEVLAYGAGGATFGAGFGLAGRGIQKLSPKARELWNRVSGNESANPVEEVRKLTVNGTPEEKAVATEIIDAVGEELGLVRNATGKSAQESAAVFPAKSAEESAAAFTGDVGPARREELIAQFNEAKTEKAKIEEDLVSFLGARLKGPETVTYNPETPLDRIQLDMLDARRGASAKERARLEKKLGITEEQPLPTTEEVLQDVENIPGIGGRAGARKMGLEGGQISLDLAFRLARSGTGAAIGATQGETPEEKLQYAALGAGAGLAADPKLFATMFKGGSSLWNKIRSKSPQEVDQMIRSGTIAPDEFSPASQDPAVVQLGNALKREAETAQIKATDMPVFEAAVTRPSELIGPKGEKTRQFFAALAPSRAIGNDSNEAILRFKNSVAGTLEMGGRLRQNIQKTIARDANPVEAQRAINSYLDGETNSLPGSLKSIQTDLDLAREKILDLQKQLLSNIDAGITPDPNNALGGKLLDNGQRVNSIIQQSMDRGNYLTREYRFFTDKKYFPTKQQRQGAVDELANSFYLEATTAGSPITREQSLSRASQYLDDIDLKKLSEVGSFNLYPSSIDGFMKGRSELGPAFRGYLGEITDPGERVAGTMGRLARSVYRDATDSEIIKNFQRLGIGTENRADPMFVPLKLRRAPGDAPKLFVPPHVQDAINELYLSNADEEIGNMAFRTLKDSIESGVSASKAVKVLLNPASYSVQFYGNAANLLGQGINPFGNGFSRGLRLAVSEFGPIERLTKNPEARKALLNDIQEMTKYGIKGANILDSDIRSGLETGVFGKALQKGLDPFAKTYTIPDTVGRYVSWKANQKMVSNVFPSASPEMVKLFAAEVTNNTYQNYQRLSSSLKKASRLGFIPQFASFTLEFARNQYHQGRIIRQMLNGTFGQGVVALGAADRRRMQIEGAKRLASLTTLYAGTAGAIKVFNEQNGVDQKTENALRDVAIPDYDRSRMLAMTLDKKTMTGKYANPSYIIPHATALSAFEAGLNGADASSVSNLITEELVGEGSFFARSLYSAVLGFNPRTGKPISYQTKPFERAKDAIKFFVEDAFTPGFSREVKKLGEAQRGQGDLAVDDVIARQFGARFNPINVKENARFKFKSISDRIQLASGDYTAARDYRNLSPQDVEAQYQKSNQARRDAMAVVLRHVDSLRTIGMNDNDIVQIMRDGGIASKDILAAFDKEIPDLPRVKRQTPSEYWSEVISVLPAEKQMEEIRKLARSRETASLAQSLDNLRKQDLNYKARGIDAKDRLVLALGIADGERASYLHKRAKESGDYNTFVQNAIRRNLITKDVMQQMNILRNNEGY